ncbi:hypothetical protein, partial [Aestuariivirga sp.]|uniref:hypothetical protein n=1 Tax=Aestuariivirga sp. TaxID=2650926 RepID=UPI0038D2037B
MFSFYAAKYNMKYHHRVQTRDGIVKQIEEVNGAFQYMITLQTKLRPAEKKVLQEYQVMNLSAEFRHVSNRLNCELFGIRFTRKPKTFCVLSVPIIEGFDKSAHGFHTAVSRFFRT